jgi:uncharacterized protein (TIGR02265 family)
MSEPWIVFNHCAEALLKSIAPHMTPELKSKLKAVGLDADAPLLPAYDYQTWSKVLAVTAQEVLPSLDAQAAHHQLGEWLTDAYLENFIGRALKPIVKLIGTRRTMNRMRQNFRVANNYAEAEATDVGPGHVHLRMNERGLMAYFNRGILARGLQLTDPQHLSVEIISQDAEGVTFSIRWDV